MEEHGIEPDEFLDIVHQIDRSPLTPNPALATAIAALPGRKLILTNGTRHHAEEVMRRLEVDKHFEDIFDIRAAELEPKPRPLVYERFLARHRVDPKRAVIFEDLARNLEVPHALGMITVLVVPKGAAVVLREDWELAGRDDPHVDYVTDDLADFLREIAVARSRQK
jgi:putative hydrolase of the HAD superfamily